MSRRRRVVRVHALLALGALFLGAADVGAQDISVGVLAGLSRSTLPNTQKIVEDAAPDNFIFGVRSFVAGGFVRVPVRGPLELRPEVLFVEKGFQLTVQTESVGGRYLFDYLEIPVFLSFDHSAWRVVWYVDGGPYVATRLSEDLQIKRPGTDWESILVDGKTPHATDVSAALHRFDAGVALEAGVTVRRFSIGAHFSRGLRSVLAVDSLPDGDELLLLAEANGAKNQTLATVITWRIR